MKHLFFLLVAALVAGCTTTKYVTVPEVHTDTLKVVQQQKDSIYLHDSIHIRETTDTVFMEKWHTRFVERLRIDTLYQSRVDSVAYPIEVIKEVPAHLSWWQQARLHIANILLWLIALTGVAWLIRRKWGI